MSFIVQKISENLRNFKIRIILLNNPHKIIRVLFSLKYMILKPLFQYLSKKVLFISHSDENIAGYVALPYCMTVSVKLGQVQIAASRKCLIHKMEKLFKRIKS